MIVSLHVATGAAAGAATGSRLAAVMLGPILHLAGDRLPHQDIGSRRFEIGSGLAALVLLVITILKCFLFDLAQLGGLYRVASFVGLAACLAVVALLLQRFVLVRSDAKP